MIVVAARAIAEVRSQTEQLVGRSSRIHDQSRKDVTDADINAEREMCQWFDDPPS